MVKNAIEMARTIFAQVKSIFSMPNVHIGLVDIIEILIITVLFYNIMIWIKNTRAWNLFKGILFILVFALIAAIFQMSTILWLARNTLNIALIALIIIFQPELRKALESLGDKNFIFRFLDIARTDLQEKFSDDTIEELVSASMAMGRVKTGALIVLEDSILLDEFVRTGIDVDGLVTAALLINIFEKNTPLHDGAVIIRGNRVVSATCYLPLSDSLEVSKDLGTRHRAALGISDVSDSMTIIVSEESGCVSVAYKGEIVRNLDAESLRAQLKQLQKPHLEETGFTRVKRWFANEEKNSGISDN